MRLLAEEAGHVIVTLNVTWSHSGVQRTFTDSITIQVRLGQFGPVLFCSLMSVGNGI